MLEGLPVANLTAPALLGITILLLLFGKIVPRATLQDKIEECENWRKVAEAEREARITSDAQTRELLELAKTTHNIIVAMFGSAERLHNSGEADALPSPK